MKQQSLLVLALSLVLVLSGGLQAAVQTEPRDQVETNALQSGSINGLNYSYGQIDFSASGNLTQTFNGTVEEVFNETRSRVETIELITDAQPLNTFFKVMWSEEVGNETMDFEEYFNEATLDFFVNTTLAVTIPARFNPTNLTDGAEQMKLNITEAYSVETAFVVSQNGKFLGQFPVNTTHLEFFYKENVSAPVTKRSGIIFPEILLFNVTTQSYEVYIERQKVAISVLGYFVQHSVAYNVSASAYQVKITNGKNLGLEVNMFDKIQANYTEVIISYVGYYFQSIDYTYLEFATNGTRNGTAVPFDMYPRSMLPVSYSAQGVAVEAGFQHISTTVLSTFQSVAGIFVSKLNASSSVDQTDIEARLAVWGLQTSTTMAAYEDGNANGRLDLALTDDGLTVDSDDRVAYLGLGEAFQTTIVNGRYRSEEFNSSLVFHGLGVSHNQTNVNETRQFFGIESFGYGNVDANPTTDFRWEEPVANPDGTVEFDFGVTYNNFPVTWLNLTNPENSVIDNENIGYDYHIFVDPVSGHARISPTWRYGGIVDAGLKSAMNGMSLATVVKSEFFAAQAVYSATESNDTVPSSRTQRFGVLGIRSGAGDPATEIDVTVPRPITPSTTSRMELHSTQ